MMQLRPQFMASILKPVIVWIEKANKMTMILDSCYNLAMHPDSDTEHGQETEILC